MVTINKQTDMSKSNQSDAAEMAAKLGLDERHQTGLLRKVMLVGLALASVVVILAVTARSKSARPAYRYELAPVKRGTIAVKVSATGTLEPIKKVQVGIEVSGTIQSVEADYNSQVKVGQVLARLDTTRLEAQTLQAKAAVASARAKVAQTEANLQEAVAQIKRLNRVNELSGGKVPSLSDFDTAQAALARAKADQDSASASLEQAQAALTVNETELGKAVIRSPINGMVLKRSVEPGQTVAASFQAPELFTLAEDLTQMELQVDVDEADVGRVKEGQEAVFTVDAYPDREFPARITQVRFGSQTVDGVVTYKTILRVDNRDMLLRPGMTATAELLVVKKEKVLLVSNGALRFVPAEQTPGKPSKGGSFVSKILPRPPTQDTTRLEEGNPNAPVQRVWVLRDGQPVPVTFIRGESDGLQTEVAEGELNEGAEVIIEAVPLK